MSKPIFLKIKKQQKKKKKKKQQENYLKTSADMFTQYAKR